MTEILATEATLSTLKVEIKALTVSGKQMTLAVFRQLPEIEATSGDGQLFSDGRYWGIVRYDIKDQGRLWVVIEFDGKLHRARIDEDFTRNHYKHYLSTPELKMASQQTKAAFDAANKLEVDLTAQNGSPLRPRFDFNLPWGPEREAENRKWNDNFNKWQTELKDKIASFHLQQQQAEQRWDAIANECVRRRSQSMNTLRSLPQLYIAV